MINITIIPFLLALVPDNDHTEWNNVEYTFKLNKSTAVYTDTFENVTATITCRPNQLAQSVKDIRFLFCDVHKIIISSLSEQTSHMSDDIWEDITEHEIDKIDFTPQIDKEEMPNRTFTLQFGTRGVQDFTVAGVKSESRLLDLIPDIAEQFDMSIDLSTERNSMKNYENETSGTHVISSLMQTNEKTIRASKCNTSLIITYTPSNQSHKYRNHHNENKNSHYYLKLLPISYTKPAKRTFSIKRKRIACLNQPKSIEFFTYRWIIKNYTEYYNLMEVHRTRPKFTSHTHLEGYVLSQQKSIVHFREDVHLELHHIKPIE